MKVIFLKNFLAVIAVMLMNVMASHLQAREQPTKEVNISLTHRSKLGGTQVLQSQWAATFRNDISEEQKRKSLSKIQQVLADYLEQTLFGYSYSIKFSNELKKTIIVVVVKECLRCGGAIVRRPSPPPPPITPPFARLLNFGSLGIVSIQMVN